MNLVMISGRVGKDPKIGETKENAVKYAFISGCISEYFSGEEHTTWVSVSCWGKLAEIVEQIDIRKGDLIEVTAKITTRKGESGYEEINLNASNIKRVLKSKKDAPIGADINVKKIDVDMELNGKKKSIDI